MLTYIYRVLALQTTSPIPSVSSQRLDELASEAGFTPAQHEGLAREIAKRRETARQQLHRKNVFEAVAELTTAAALSPEDPEVLDELRRALHAHDVAGSPDAAEHLARLDRFINPEPQTETRPPDAVASTVDEREPSLEFDIEPDPEVTPPPVPADAESEASITFAPPEPEDAVPATFIGQAHGLSLVPYESHYTSYESSAYYSFTGWLKNDSDHEFTHVYAVVTAATATDDAELPGRHLLDDGDAPLPPGGVHPFSLTWEVPDEPVEDAYFQIQRLRSLHRKGGDSPVPVDVSWIGDPAPGLSVRECRRTYADEEVMLVLQLRNHGEPVDDLDIHLRARHGHDVVGEERCPVVVAPPLVHGEVRRVTVRVKTTNRADRCEVTLDAGPRA